MRKLLWIALAIYTAANVTLIVGALLKAETPAKFDERFGSWKCPPQPHHWAYRPCNLIQEICIIG